MIQTKQVKNLFYIDRDTDIEKLAKEIEIVRAREIREFIAIQKERLQSKEAGAYHTLEDVLKVKDGGLEDMQRFFRGAVVPYFIRQEFDFWEEKIPFDIQQRGTDHIKEMVGFMKYDHTGHMTDEVNSMSTFEKVKDLQEFLTNVEEVCFKDSGYIFPDSKHFKKLINQKGRDSAERQVFFELKEKYKNRFANREVINF